MPARKNEPPPHRHSETPAAPRRKSKPKFELPPETEAAAQDVGWVYRADEELPPADIKETVAEIAAEVRHVVAEELAVGAVLATGKLAHELPTLPRVKHEPPNMTSVAVMTGLGVFAIGMIATGLVTLAAFGLITAPVRFVRHLAAAK